jgi:hypothetical protein
MPRASVLAVVLLSACYVPPHDAVAADGGPRAACSHDTCSNGCCDNGVCASGYEDDACGLLGRTCDVCPVQQRCSGTRRCEKRPPDAGTGELQTIFADPGGSPVPPNAEPPARCYAGKCP